MSLPTRGMHRVERANSEDELSGLQAAWTALLTDVPAVPIFLTWEWVSTCWRHYGHGRELWLLIVKDETGRLAGLAPWMLMHHRLGPLRLRRIRFIGSGLVCPCHLDVIARPGEKAAVCAALLSYLYANRREWDVVDLEGVAENCVLESHFARLDGRCRVTKDLVCPLISLPDSWEAYHKSLKKKLRRNLRYFDSLLEREHPDQAFFHRVTEADELSSAMDSLVTMHQKRWHGKGQVTCFDNSRYVRFHCEIAALALERGWLRFYQLKVADQAIAALYCFRHQDTFYAYQIGFDPDWSRYSPGRLLIAHVIQESIKEKARAFDWLRGEDEYKLAWASEESVDSYLLLGTGWKGHLWLFGVDVWRMAISIGRRTLPRAFQQRIERFFSARRQ